MDEWRREGVCSVEDWEGGGVHLHASIEYIFG